MFIYLFKESTVESTKISTFKFFTQRCVLASDGQPADQRHKCPKSQQYLQIQISGICDLICCMVLTAILIAYMYTRLAVGECDILRRSCGQVLFTEFLTSWIEELCWQTLSLQVNNCRRWRSVRNWRWPQVSNGCCRSDDGFWRRARAKSVIAVWRFSGTLTALRTFSVWRPLIVATVRGIMSERKYYRDWGCETGPLSALQSFSNSAVGGANILIFGIIDRYTNVLAAFSRSLQLLQVVMTA